MSDILSSLNGLLKVSERSRDLFGGLLAQGRHDVKLTHIIPCNSHQKVSFEDGKPTLEMKDPLPKGKPTPELYLRFENGDKDYISTYRPLIGYLKPGDITPEKATEAGMRLETIDGTPYYVDLNGEKIPGKRATQEALDTIRDLADGCGLEVFDSNAMVGKTLSVEVYPRPEYKGEVRLEVGFFRKAGNKSICFKPKKTEKAEEPKVVAQPTQFTSVDDMPY